MMRLLFEGQTNLSKSEANSQPVFEQKMLTSLLRKINISLIISKNIIKFSYPGLWAAYHKFRVVQALLGQIALGVL